MVIWYVNSQTLDSQHTFIEAQRIPHIPLVRQASLVINFPDEPQQLRLESGLSINTRALPFSLFYPCTSTVLHWAFKNQVSVIHCPDIQWLLHWKNFSRVIFHFICLLALDTGHNEEGNQDKNLVFCNIGGLSVHVYSGGDRPLGCVESSSGERKHNMWGSPLRPLETL